MSSSSRRKLRAVLRFLLGWLGLVSLEVLIYALAVIAVILVAYLVQSVVR